MKQEKLNRLPPREGSLEDWRDPEKSPRYHLAMALKAQERLSHSSTNLRDENEQLRRQVQDLQAQVSVLRRRSVQQSASAKGTPLVLELPRAMKGSSISSMIPFPLTWLQEKSGRPVKDHESFTADDDQSTVEPSPDREIHESLKGLKQRNNVLSLPEDPRRSKRQAQENVNRCRAGSHGVSSSSEREDSDTDMDDEDGEYDMESRRLIIHALAEARPTPTSRAGPEGEPMWSVVSDRAGWLVGLLVLQSMSSFIISRNEGLLQRHLVIVRFLTMLVGAGGNAGNQASVRVIRGLAVGSIDSSNQQRFLKREFTMGLALSIILGVAGCIRAAVFMTPWLETLAITTSLFMIVIISIALGSLMPLGMKKIGIDPAHSSTTIQVVMDILGVTITVCMSSLVLDSGFRDWLSSSSFGTFMDA